MGSLRFFDHLRGLMDKQCFIGKEYDDWQSSQKRDDEVLAKILELERKRCRLLVEATLLWIIGSRGYPSGSWVRSAHLHWDLYMVSA